MCGKEASNDPRHQSRTLISEVMTLPIRNTIMIHCQKRGDAWGNEVDTRINACIDLVAAVARYHYSCYREFTLLGPECVDLHSQMTAMSGGVEVYSIKRMKQRLQEHYGDYVFFADVGQGKIEVTCFRDMANYIVNER